MIYVTVTRSSDRIAAFELTGHADSGPYGYDLVCAGVSAVSFGTINAVMKCCDVELDIEQGHEGGYLHVSIPDTIQDSQMEKVQLLLEGMLVALETIERDYGQFIKIDRKSTRLNSSHVSMSYAVFC